MANWMTEQIVAARRLGRPYEVVDSQTLLVAMGGFGSYNVMHEGSLLGTVIGREWGWSFKPLHEDEEQSLDRTGTRRMLTLGEVVTELIDFVL